MEKQSAIRQMFFGQRGQLDNIKNTKRCALAAKSALALEDELREAMGEQPHLRKLLDTLMEQMSNSHFEALAAYYEEGFKFGLLVGVDASR